MPGTALPGQAQLASSTLPVLPSPLARLALPASLLSISSPLPQVQADHGAVASAGGASESQQLSPPLLAVRPPPSSPLLSSALSSPRPPRPHSPTPRVIQYAASRTKAPSGPSAISPRGHSSPTTPPRAQGPLSPPAFGLLTAPTWSTTGSRAQTGLLSIGQPGPLPRTQTSPLLRAQVAWMSLNENCLYKRSILRWCQGHDTQAVDCSSAGHLPTYKLMPQLMRSG